MYMKLICIAIIIAMLVCWIIQFITITGIREYMEVHATKLLSKMVSCDFCLSWWLCLAYSICFAISIGDSSLIICAFISTPIARHFL